MELNHLRHFVVLAEETHFGRAAARLGMSQPPLSRSIKRLEDTLGVLLFDRSKRGVALSEAGRLLLPEAQRLLLQADHLRRTARRSSTGELARLDVGFVGTATYETLPILLKQFHGLKPDVDVKLFEMNSKEQLERLLSGTLEIGILHPESSVLEGISQLLIKRWKIVAAIPEDSPLAGHESVSINELADYPLILPGRANGSTSVNAFLHACRSAGLLPNTAQEAFHTNSAVNLVAAGLGVAIVMEPASLMGRTGVAFRPIADLPPHVRWELVVAWRPERLAAPAEAFLAVARQLAASTLEGAFEPA